MVQLTFWGLPHSWQCRKKLNLLQSSWFTNLFLLWPMLVLVGGRTQQVQIIIKLWLQLLCEVCNEHPCTFCGRHHRTTTPPPLLFLSSLALPSHFAIRSWNGKIFCCKSRYCVCHYLNIFLLIWSQASKAVREMTSNCQHAKPSSFKSVIYLELKNARYNSWCVVQGCSNSLLFFDRSHWRH